MARPKGWRNPYENQNFYVFYGKGDVIRCCGTARQLVEDGIYKSIKEVHSIASRIRAGRYVGNYTEVYILK